MRSIWLNFNITETLEYIERYFGGKLSADEKQAFEKKCETDPAFAQTVSFYVASREALHETLYRQKKESFNELYRQLSAKKKAPTTIIRTLVPYITAAAACLLIFIGWLYLFNSPSPRQLATAYIDDNLYTLSVTMGAQDSLQSGIEAFNRQDYLTAERIFLSLSHKKDQTIEAIKYLGIVYLITGEYEKAIGAFETLSAYPDLYANVGPFYTAIALMRRSVGDDQEKAKKILRQVIEQQLPGHKEASHWIEHL